MWSCTGTISVGECKRCEVIWDDRTRLCFLDKNAPTALLLLSEGATRSPWHGCTAMGLVVFDCFLPLKAHGHPPLVNVQPLAEYLNIFE